MAGPNSSNDTDSETTTIDPATDLAVTDTLPSEVSYVSATPDQGSCSESAGTVTCDLGAIANGDTVDVTITVDAVTGDQTEPNASNDTDSETTTINPATDLAVTKTDSADPVTVGDQYSYTVTVTNNGPDDATGVVVTDTLPGQVSYVSASPEQGSCSETSGTVTCTLGDLANGETVTVVITVEANTAGTASNTATTSGDQDDPATSHNDDTETTTIDSPPPPPADPASVGDTVFYDANGDGVQDSGEPGIVGVTVRLRDAASTVIATTVSTAGGHYGFAGLPAGDYTVEIQLPDGTVLTTGPNAKPASLEAGEAEHSVDFGIIGTGAIGQVIWEDTNENGIVDSDEPGASGVVVTAVWAGIDGVLGTSDDLSFGAVTDATGEYSITALPAGLYQITVDGSTLPAGYQLTYTPDGNGDLTDTLMLGAGQTLSNENFGFVVADALPMTGSDIDRLIGIAIALFALGVGLAYVGAPAWAETDERRDTGE